MNHVAQRRADYANANSTRQMACDLGISKPRKNLDEFTVVTVYADAGGDLVAESPTGAPGISAGSASAVQGSVIGAANNVNQGISSNSTLNFATLRLQLILKSK